MKSADLIDAGNWIRPQETMPPKDIPLILLVKVAETGDITAMRKSVYTGYAAGRGAALSGTSRGDLASMRPCRSLQGLANPTRRLSAGNLRRRKKHERK